MILLLTLIEIILLCAVIAILLAALVTVSGNVKKTRALDNLKDKAKSIFVTNSASADDCAELKRLISEAQKAGIEQGVIDKVTENINGLCPLINLVYYSLSSRK